MSLPEFNLPQSGGAKDIFRYLANYSINNPVYQDVFAHANEGLPGDVSAALNYEAGAGSDQRYQDAASAVRTNLLQRGLSGGAIPANPGALLRGYGPLQADLARSKSQAGMQTRLADYTARLANRQKAYDAFGVGINNALSSASGMANLESSSFKNILLASLLGAGTKAIADPKTFNSIISAIGRIFGGGGSNGPIDLTAANDIIGLLNGGSGGGPGLSPAVMDMLNSSIGGNIPGQMAGIPQLPGPVSDATGILGNGNPVDEWGTPIATGGGAATTAATGGTGGAGVGGTLAAVLGNPITWGAAAMIPGFIGIKQSQVHPTADYWVQNFQNRFDSNMKKIGDETGVRLSPLDADMLRRQEVQDYLNIMYNFSLESRKNWIVANQALNDPRVGFKAVYGDPSNFGVDIQLPTWGSGIVGGLRTTNQGRFIVSGGA